LYEQRLEGSDEDYALSAIRLFGELPKKTEAQIMGRQLLRSGTSSFRLDLLALMGFGPAGRISSNFEVASNRPDT
jgi:hypothetical protein